MPFRQPYKIHHTLFGIVSPKKGEPLNPVSHTGVYQQVCEEVTVKREKSRRSLSTTLCLILLGLSVVVNVGLVGFLAYRSVFCNNDSKAGHHDVTISSDLSGYICVSCDSLHVQDPTSGILVPEVKVIEFSPSSTMCCLKHKEHIQTLLKLVVGEYYHYRHGGNMTGDFAVSSTSPAAHLYLKRDRGTAGDRLTWDDEIGYGTAHVTGGVSYKNGSLRVPKNGVYFLYSHVTISSVTTDSDQDLIHCVQRYNPNLPSLGNQILMISKTSLGANTKRTSFLGANLKLRRDDEIFVEISNQSLIYNFPPANYFGLHLL